MFTEWVGSYRGLVLSFSYELQFDSHGLKSMPGRHKARIGALVLHFLPYGEFVLIAIRNLSIRLSLHDSYASETRRPHPMSKYNDPVSGMTFENRAGTGVKSETWHCEAEKLLSNLVVYMSAWARRRRAVIQRKGSRLGPFSYILEQSISRYLLLYPLE